jgi:CRISPR-associated endonuclease/helicase Cas3
MLVISPAPIDAPEAGWIKDALPGTAAVYRDPALLWRSARAIFRREVLATPEDMRRLIEEVADGDAPGAIPSALAPAADVAGGRAAAAAGIGAQNVLKFADGYKRSAGAWEPDTHTPTRLEDRPMVTLRLALLREGRILPYAQGTGDIRRDWSLSEVSVAKHRFATSPIPPEYASVVEAAKRDWGRWERESERFVLVLLELTPEHGLYLLRGLTEGGSASLASYTPAQGLSWRSVE